MASIHKDPRSRFWQAAWRDANGKLFIRSTKIEHSPFHEDGKERGILTGKNKRLAFEAAARFEAATRGNMIENQLRQIVADIARETNVEDLAFAKTETYLNDWLARTAKTRSPSSVSRYKGVIRNFLESLGRKAEAPLANITPRDVEAFADKRLESGCNPSTVRVDMKILNTPFALALRQGKTQI